MRRAKVSSPQKHISSALRDQQQVKSRNAQVQNPSVSVCEEITFKWTSPLEMSLKINKMSLWMKHFLRVQLPSEFWLEVQLKQ